MKAISTTPFNAMGVIAPGAGMMIETDNEIIFNQLKFMGFIEPLEGEMETEEENKAEAKEEHKAEAKRAKKK